MDTLHGMRAFISVVEHEGFAPAARAMGVSRSMVSKLVGKLEDEVGGQLLRRSTRRLSVTDTGRAFYERCLQIVADTDAALSAVRELQDAPAGRLRVNAPMTLGTRFLSPLVAQFMATHPQLRIELVLNDRYVDPLEEGFDVTLRVAVPQSTTSLVCLQIAQVERVLCAAPDYLSARGQPTDPMDLRHHRCLQYGYEASGATWRLQGASGVVSVSTTGVMWSNNGQVLRDAAIAAQGIALLPRFIVAQALASGALQTVCSDHPPTSTGLLVLYPRHRHLSVKVRLFVEMLQAAVAGEAGEQNGLLV